MGRPNHEYWALAKFQSVVDQKTGKTMAQCYFCDRRLANTSAERLKMHRLVQTFVHHRDKLHCSRHE